MLFCHLKWFLGVFVSIYAQVKTTKTIMKKTRESVIKTGSVETAEGIRDLDELIGLTIVVNSRVDDLVCGIYAPVNYAQLLDNVSLHL